MSEPVALTRLLVDEREDSPFDVGQEHPLSASAARMDDDASAILWASHRSSRRTLRESREGHGRRRTPRRGEGPWHQRL
jgi:hypothetical protein